MALPSKTTVLIVGAGPAGLAAALSLLHNDFQDFIIVDAVPQWKNASRAIVIHAATLEALDAIGCGDDLVSKGNKCTTFDVGTRSTKLLTPYFESLKPHTRHPYILAIPQNVTEHTLEKKLNSLGVFVHRPLKVIGLRRNVDDPLFSDVTLEDGRVIVAKYVVGADGAHSVVRTTAGIGFSDPTITKGEADNNMTQVVLADVAFDTANADHQSALSGTLSPNSYFVLFPLPPSFNEYLAAECQVSISERIYRIGCGVPLAEGEIPQSPSKEYLQNLVNRFAPYYLVSDPSLNKKPMAIKDVVWSSRFRNRAAIADSTFIRLGSNGLGGEGGIILLVGDAGHVHSPVGGQGMNLGLRDAIFLGDALVKHIRAAETEPISEADRILREFADARHARALEVIQLSKGLMSVVGKKYQRRAYWWCPFDSDTVRTWMLWVLGMIPFLMMKMAWQLSGLGAR